MPERKIRVSENPTTWAEVMRARLGVTQKEFAEMLGIPIRTVEAWSVGRRVPPDWLVELIEFAVENGYNKSAKK